MSPGLRIVRVFGWVVVIGGALVAVVAFFGSRAPGSSSTSALAFAVASLAVSAGAFWFLRRTAPPPISPLRGGIPDSMYASGATSEALDDPFRDLPFEVLLPVGWRPGLAESTSVEGRGIASDAMFVAHDPDSLDDSGYMSTLAIFASEPVEDADMFLAHQEEEFRSSAQTDASLESFDLTRVDLRAGPSLRAFFVHDSVQVQYYLPAAIALVQFWFTAPIAARYRCEAEFEVMAQSFRWKDDSE